MDIIKRWIFRFQWMDYETAILRRQSEHGPKIPISNGKIFSPFTFDRVTRYGCTHPNLTLRVLGMGEFSERIRVLNSCTILSRFTLYMYIFIWYVLIHLALAQNFWLLQNWTKGIGQNWSTKMSRHIPRKKPMRNMCDGFETQITSIK